MTHEELRARIRDLIAAGDLPDEPPVVVNAGDGFSRFKRGAPCLICGEPNPTTAYFWVGGRVAHSMQRATRCGSSSARKPENGFEAFL